SDWESAVPPDEHPAAKRQDVSRRSGERLGEESLHPVGHFGRNAVDRSRYYLGTDSVRCCFEVPHGTEAFALGKRLATHGYHGEIGPALATDGLSDPPLSVAGE